MNRLFCVFVFSFLLFPSYFAQSVEVKAAKPITTSTGLICRTKQQDLELRHWIAGIQEQSRIAIDQAAAAQKSEGEVKLSLGKAEQAGIELKKERDQAMIDLAHVLKKLHFLKWLVSALAVAAVVFGILNLPIPMPYKLYALLGAPAIATAAVWIFL